MLKELITDGITTRDETNQIKIILYHNIIPMLNFDVHYIKNVNLCKSKQQEHVKVGIVTLNRE